MEIAFNTAKVDLCVSVCHPKANISPFESLEHKQ